MKRSSRRAEAGFTLIELMAAAGIFLVLSAAAFTLLALSQKSYQNESQVLNSFQEARLGLDQMVRDINIAGYPPQSQFSTLPAATKYAVAPIAWSPNYSANPCLIEVNCATPTDTDVIIETDPDNSGAVQWIRYELIGTTLYRGMTPKVGSADPDSTTAAGQMAPFVQNVMNDASSTQIAQFQAIYPQMFPAGNPVPIFQYYCDVAGGTQSCSSISGTPASVRDVSITLIVMAPTPDAQTGQPRLLELTGRAHRINPNP